MGVIRRLPLDAAAAVLLPITVVLFAFGSSSVTEFVTIGSRGRWVALLALACVAGARALARKPRLSSVPAAWVVAGTLLVLGAESALWSVDPRLTIGRTFTVGVLFVAGAALALGAEDPRAAAAQVLLGVLRGIAAVALISLLVLAVARHDAVLAATEGAGWRFRGVGQNPNTVSMLLAVGLALTVWRLFDGARRVRLEGLALLLLFAGEIGFSGSRGALIAGFAGAAATAAILAPAPRWKLGAVASLAVLAAASFELATLPAAAPPAATPAPAAGAAKPAPTRGIDAQQVFRLEDELGFPFGGGYQPPVPRTIFGSSGRAQAWNGALEQGARRPVAGYGFGTENKVFVDRFYSFEGGFVENTYLGLFVQLGTAGVALFVLLLGALTWTAVRLARRFPRGDAGPAAAATGVLLAAIVIGGTQTGLLSAGNIAASSVWLCVLTLPALGRELAA